MSILLNASNLHSGGGVQVASSFIFELSVLLSELSEDLNISVLCSTVVRSNLPDNLDLAVFHSFKEFNTYGYSLKDSRKTKELFDNFDICFTIFGPFYLNINAKKHICGFAQPWIAYPKNDAYQLLKIKNKISTKLKYLIQSYFFKQYDKLIVEQKHVKDALVKLNYFEKQIDVVSNCVSSIYDNKNLWRTVFFDKSKLINNYTLGFIGRGYTHKNLAILKDVSKLLELKFNFKCDFLFTLSKSEMKSFDLDGLDNFFSVGPISVYQCPDFYKLLDALIFPSLLECFSASPIEAMKMNTTVIASDYPFVKEVCENAAFYFNPLSAESIANSIFNAFSCGELREEKKKLGIKLVSRLPTAKNRAESYLNIIKNNI